MRRIGVCTATLLGVIVLSPWLLGTSYLLHYDLVFVPHLPLSAGTLGLDGGVPRAVPNDIVVALLNVALPGWLVERLVLLGFFVMIGWGLDRWRAPAVARFSAAVALCWNPWVGERLAIGHWGYVWGYAALVWVVVGALGVREQQARRPADLRTLGAGLVMGSLSGSTGAVLVAIAVLVLLSWPGQTRVRPRTMLVGALAWLALNAAWWFPFLTLAPSQTADSRGVTAFAARADSSAGLVPSLVSGGGIWHSASWFSSRSGALVVWLVALCAIAGVAMTMRRTRATMGGATVALGVAGLVLAGAASVPLGRDVVAWVVLHLPGGGLLRDAQKFSALWVVPAGLGIGFLVEAARRRGAGTLLAPCAVVAGLVGPIATLPGLALCDSGRWAGAQYPQEFEAVRQQVAGQGGGVAIFPWQLYRRYAWNNDQVVLDPWQRLLPNTVVIDDDLPLVDGVVRGENSDAARITRALAVDRNRHVTGGDHSATVSALKAAGVRFVVEQKDQPVGAGQAPAWGKVIHDGPVLRVRDLGDAGTSSAGRPVAWWAASGLVLTGLAVCGSAFAMWRVGRRHVDDASPDVAR